MSFWKVVKEVSTQPIRAEAERPFLLGIAGRPAFIEAVVDVLMGPSATPQERALADARLVRVPSPVEVEGIARLSRCDVVIAGPEAPDASRIRPADVLPVGDPSLTPQLLLERRPDWRLALARHFPGLRPLAADQIIQDFSKANAQYAMLTAVPQAVPVLAPFFPPVLAADIWVLTKNQVMMIIRLAACYGRTPEPRARIREILPVVGSAFGWKTLAREILGFVPGGLGIALKASIAYSGTYMAGRAAVFYYQVGRRPTRIELGGFRREGRRKARTAVRDALETLRRGD